jgi:hypothetical protein
MNQGAASRAFPELIRCGLCFEIPAHVAPSAELNIFTAE